MQGDFDFGSSVYLLRWPALGRDAAFASVLLKIVLFASYLIVCEDSLVEKSFCRLIYCIMAWRGPNKNYYFIL